MRNQRSGNRKRFKNEPIYVIRRLIVVIIAILFIYIVAKLIFAKGTHTIVSENDNIQENSQIESSEEKIEKVANEDKNEKEEEQLTHQEPKKDITFSMAITGDIMCHNTMYQDAYNSSDKTYDFSYMFDDIKEHIQIADIAIGNLETTFAGSKRGYSGYPTFNTPEILAKNLKKTGFDVVSTANNHCMDKGYSGIESTIDYLDEADLSHTGTFKSQEEQETILIKNVKGVNIAFLSYTYGTNGIAVPTDKKYAVNLIDKDLIKKHIELAKAKKPDVICVCMHWGIEYQTTPNKEQENLAEFLFQNGADVIIGNHPHVPQKMEKVEVELEDGNKKDGFIIYSLGNFMSNQNKKYTLDSAILNVRITKHGNDGKITIDSAKYIPIYMFKDTSKKTKKFKILDIEKNIKAYEAKASETIGKSTYNTLVEEFKNIKKIIGEEF